jgi:Zn-finger nucleic acid-binding protein
LTGARRIDMHCPICNQELQPADRQDIELNRCLGCGGAWLGPDELDKLLGWAPLAPCGRKSERWPLEIEFYDFG